MLLGKFLPPHRGHQYLVDFGRNFCDHLTVQVCTIAEEPIAGVLRYTWMRDFFAGDPAISIVHHDDENPQAPEDDPENFWEIWPRTLLKRMTAPPNYVFASETYGFRLAHELGATFIPVDIAREHFPTSGTDLRTDVVKNWQYLLPTARPHFIQRIALVGEDTKEKRALTQALATHFHAPNIAEYARTFREAHEDENAIINSNDYQEDILRGQRASEDACARQSESPVLFCNFTAFPKDIHRYLLYLPMDTLSEKALPELIAFIEKELSHKNRLASILRGSKAQP
jgi:HTH-type transcriptional regulator, transcriptional repressor of NAD biosynthesis genes